ncbi:MAG: ribbon-helix-helix protein, CopG family [Planctomycetota bacterium]|nr:ribbon-helix-helix protein, CopG family [Planctomycetota bacterium]
MPAKNKVTISVRLEPALAKRMKKLADATGRSASSLIEYILADRIEYEEYVVKAIQKGREDFKAGRYMEAEEFFRQWEAELAKKAEGSRRKKRTA